MEASRPERDLQNWIADRHPDFQADPLNAVVLRRHRTAAFYSYLSDDDGPWEAHINGPEIRSAQLDAGGGSILWLNEGKAAAWLEDDRTADRQSDLLDNSPLDPTGFAGGSAAWSLCRGAARPRLRVEMPVLRDIAEVVSVDPEVMSAAVQRPIR